MLHTHTHTHTHTPQCKCGLRRAKGTAAVCERCDLPVREFCCDIRSEQGRPSYGWRRVEILDGGRAIGRAKKEGRNSYGGVWYWFYSKLLKQTGPTDG